MGSFYFAYGYVKKDICLLVIINFLWKVSIIFTNS